MEMTNIKLQFKGYDLSINLEEATISFSVEREGEVIDELSVAVEEFEAQSPMDGEEIKDFDEFGEGGPEDDFEEFQDDFDGDDDFDDMDEDDEDDEDDFEEGMALESFSAFAKRANKKVVKKSVKRRK